MRGERSPFSDDSPGDILCGAVFLLLESQDVLHGEDKDKDKGQGCCEGAVRDGDKIPLENHQHFKKNRH